MLTDKKILITGISGMVPRPIAAFLAKNNEVWGIARFADTKVRAEIEGMGVTTRAIDLSKGELSAIPEDFTHIMHCAHTRLGAGDFPEAIQVNAVGAGRVLQHCRAAQAAIVVSSGAVYSPRNDEAYYSFKERDDIGRGYAPWAPTSPISKASLEAVARFCAEGFDLPTTIVRLNMVYGPLGGMPIMDMDAVVKGEQIMTFSDPYPANPIHADDMCEQIEALFDAASSPATLVNWCGDDIVSRREWSERCGKLAEKPVYINALKIPDAPCGSVLHNEKRLSITGPCKTKFWYGFDAIYQQRYGQQVKPC